MKRYLFLFGRTPALSLLELQTFFPETRVILPGIAEIHSDSDLSDLIHILGGTVKIAEVLETIEELDADRIALLLASQMSEKRITFGISVYGASGVPHALAVTVKDALVSRGLSARYIDTKGEESLSSVVVSKQHVQEIVAVKQGSTYILALTRAIQDFENWNKRDFGRPEADPKAGMLPPKVARMIVNIAIGIPRTGFTPTVLDPFCGVGTIIAEASIRGANTIGADISDAAIAHAKKNIEWLRRQYTEVHPLYTKFLVSDATHMSEHVPASSVDAIVTEPYMGETVNTKKAAALNSAKVKNILKGLEKLYIGALREWVAVLKPGGRVVMAMPTYAIGRDLMRVKNVVDRCESLGYTLLTGPIEYSRPQAVVRREFFVFQKN